MVLRRAGTVVAAAQARVVRLPGTGAGIAYIRWGPLWRRNGAPADAEVFRRALRALRDELSRRRGLVLRVYPLAFRGEDQTLAHVLEEEGYAPLEGGKREGTLLLGLEPSLPELRAALDQKWRNGLNRAERNGLELTEGEDDALFDAIDGMYEQMKARKGLAEPNDIEHLRHVQRQLPDGAKLRVVVCRLRGELCAGAIFATLGDTGLYVRGATTEIGMKTQASYMVQWAFVTWLKDHGFARYDLNGINAVTNPGTYHFKRGLGGKHGAEQQLLGIFQVSDSVLSDWIVRGGERLVVGYRRLVDTAVSLGAALVTAYAR
jgi:hypothetical protein